MSLSDTPSTASSPAEYRRGLCRANDELLMFEATDRFSPDNESAENLEKDIPAPSPAELNALGHSADTLTKIIRRKCTDCCAGQLAEVRNCAIVSCDLWPYRMGNNPFAKRNLTDAQRDAARERMASARAKKGAQ